MTGLIIENANLLDLAVGETLPATSVRVEGDRIVEVAHDGGRLDAGDDVSRLDAGGRTLLPGFIDAHVHAAITTMDLAGMARRSPTRIGIEAKVILERMLRRGFTTVRDAGGLDAGLKEATELGLIRGPRIFRVAVEEAAKRRTYAFAHAYVPDAIIQAVGAGVRSIEHGNLLDAEAARVMADHGCYLVPTLVTYDQIAEFGRQLGLPAASMAKLDEVLTAGLTAIEIALAAGVQIGFGTDLLGETHDAESKEFQLRAQVQSPLDVLRSATFVNADLLGKSGELGVVAPGARADMLGIDGNPLADITLTGGQGDHLELIVRAGEIITNRLPS